MQNHDSTATRYPDFLVIGAMKCATTTLYHDLLKQSSFFLPDKESNLLLRKNGVGHAFDRARQDQVCGEVCPDYAKLPEVESVVARAACFSPKIIYLVRHPIERMISHHHFISSQKSPLNRGMSTNIDASIRDFPELINYGRYAFQLAPWIKKLGRASVLVMRFDDFVSNREDSLAKICEFTGARFDREAANSREVHNQSTSRPVLTPFWKKIRENRLYRAALRPLTSLEMRNRIRQQILPKSKSRPAPPSPESEARVTDIFRDDLEELRLLLGHEKPLWEL